MPEKIRNNPHRALLEAFDQGFAVLELVRDASGAPVDAVVVDRNPSFNRLMRVADTLGARLTDLFPGIDPARLAVYDQVLRTGEPVRIERYFAPLESWFNVRISPYDRDDRARGQLAVLVDDTTQRHAAEEALLRSEEKYRTLFDSIDEAFCIIDMHFDAAGKPVDFTYLETNPAFVRHAGMELLGRRVKDALPDYEQEWLDQYGHAVRTGETVRLEHIVHGLGDQWFQMSAFRLGGPGSTLVAILFRNITERKRSEKELQDFNARLEREVRARTAELRDSRDLVRSMLDTTLVGMALLEAVRDPKGRLLDFRLRLVNRRLETETGRSDLVGKLYGEEYPGIHEAGLFALMARVLETGVAEGMEYFYPHDGFDKWFSSMFVKIEDGLVATNLDITQRKQSERRLQEALVSLELRNGIHARAEGIAGMGTWTWDPETGRSEYSDNMFRLFGAKPGGFTPDLETVLAFVHPDDLPRLTAASELLRDGTDRPLGVEYRVRRLDGAERIFQNRVQTLRTQNGGSVIVGLTEDVTERRQADLRNRALRQERRESEERQRVELLAATLATQETERKRIAESLHNGIGQMLYGIQLNLAQLDLRPGVVWTAQHARQQRRTNRLLGETIEETRRISHQLMPSVLKDFGLEAALNELCRQFDGTLDLDCSFDLEGKDAPYLAAAIYRMVQELVANSIRHAAAKRLTVRVGRNGEAYRIEVHDDGRGFDPKRPVEGIGLKTLQEKVRLLGGVFDLDTDGTGTRVRITLPDLGGEAPAAPADSDGEACPDA